MNKQISQSTIQWTIGQGQELLKSDLINERRVNLKQYEGYNSQASSPKIINKILDHALRQQKLAILQIKALNKNLKNGKQSISLQKVKNLDENVKKGNFMPTVDLKNAFHAQNLYSLKSQINLCKLDKQMTQKRTNSAYYLYEKKKQDEKKIQHKMNILTNNDYYFGFHSSQLSQKKLGTRPQLVKSKEKKHNKFKGKNQGKSMNVKKNGAKKHKATSNIKLAKEKIIKG